MSDWKQELEDAMADSDSGILTRWSNAERVLEKHKMLYKIKATPDAFLVHPLNRASLGINAAAMHRKGARVLQVGVDPGLLTRSTAWEISTTPQVRAKQVASMRNLVESCAGLLAPLTGEERYLSTSSSHFSQFLKALSAGCRTTESFLADAHGKLCPGRWLGSDAKLQELLTHGWEWSIIKAEVESSFPKLPLLCQSALNAANSVYSPESELEVSLAIAAEADDRIASGHQSVNFAEIGKAVTAETKLEALGPTLGTFVQRYGGGPGAPFVRFLDLVAKEYDDSIELGTEYWQSVVSLKPSCEATSFPLLRVALLTTNLCAPKHKVVDGVARLLQKKDVAKLQSAKLAQEVIEAERMLSHCWAKAQSADLPHQKVCRLFGRCCIRCVSCLLHKQVYETIPATLQHVAKMFDDDLQGKVAKQATAVAAGQASSSSCAKPAGPSGFVTTEQASDQVFLTQQKLNLTPGNLYLHKDYGPDKLFQLLFIEDDKAQLKVCEALVLGGDSAQVTVPLAQVAATLKLTKAVKPVLLTAQEYGETQETSRSAILSQQCKIFCKLLKASEEEPSPGMLLVEYPAKRVYAGKDFKKGELVLVPQTDNPSKVGINPPKSPGTAFAEVEYLMAKYYVLAPKALKQEKDLSWTGSSSCYWLLGKGSEEGNMQTEVHEDEESEMCFVCYVNKRLVRKNEELILFEKKPSAAEASKKRKR